MGASVEASISSNSSGQRQDRLLHHDLRKTPYQANRTLGVLSKMFNPAVTVAYYCAACN